jgi:ribonuclease BN (tRNA processing enzyme)
MKIIRDFEKPLSLKNDGQLQVFFLGVGSAFAQKHNQLNLLLIKGNSHVCVDFGMTGPRALTETSGLRPTDIEVILPTHSHADHIGGLECLALMNRYVGQRFMGKEKLKMIINDEYQRVLWTHSLQGGLEWNEKDIDTAQKLGFSDFFKVIKPTWKKSQPREIYEVTHGDIKIEMFRTNHIPEQSTEWEASFISYGLFVDDHVFISMDTKFDKDLIDLYAGRSSIMYHDVQFFPGAVHAHLKDLKTLPDEIKKRMYLMHYADNYIDQDISDFAGWTEQGVIYSFENDADDNFMPF